MPTDGDHSVSRSATMHAGQARRQVCLSICSCEVIHCRVAIVSTTSGRWHRECHLIVQLPGVRAITTKTTKDGKKTEDDRRRLKIATETLKNKNTRTKNKDS